MISDLEIGNYRGNLHAKEEEGKYYWAYERMLVNTEYLIKHNSRQYLRLDLCFDHRQERQYSHYSPKNCQYCQLEEQLKNLETEMEQFKNEM